MHSKSACIIKEVLCFLLYCYKNRKRPPIKIAGMPTIIPMPVKQSRMPIIIMVNPKAFLMVLLLKNKHNIINAPIDNIIVVSFMVCAF